MFICDGSLPGAVEDVSAYNYSKRLLILPCEDTVMRWKGSSANPALPTDAATHEYSIKTYPNSPHCLIPKRALSASYWYPRQSLCSAGRRLQTAQVNLSMGKRTV